LTLPGQHPFERQILGEARIAGNWAGYGVDGAPARGGNHEQIRLVCEPPVSGRSHHLARTVELVRPRSAAELDSE
jgi:hypothetical protein